MTEKDLNLLSSSEDSHTLDEQNYSVKKEMSEILSDVPKRTGALYYDSDLPYLTNWNEQFSKLEEWYNLKDTNWYQGSFIKNWSLQKVFEGQNLKVVDFDNRKDATAYLKEMFIDYQGQYPALFKLDSWRYIENKQATDQLYQMISSKWPLHDFARYEEWIHVPFSSFEWFRPYIHLPIRLNGHFVYAYIARWSWWFGNNTDDWWHLLASF